MQKYCNFVTAMCEDVKYNLVTMIAKTGQMSKGSLS